MAKIGRPRLIETPEILWQHFLAYEIEAKANPNYETQWDFKKSEVVRVPKEVPLTFIGFEVYLKENEIIADLGKYESNFNGAYTEYVTIIRDIKRKCYRDKFNGAATGIYKENIIARELGLVDRKEQNIVTPEPIRVVRHDPKD